MSERATWAIAFRIFFEEARAFSKKTAGKSIGENQAEILVAHRVCINTTDARLREVGWTFDEFANYQTSPAEDAEREKIINTLVEGHAS